MYIDTGSKEEQQQEDDIEAVIKMIEERQDYQS